ncbi:hypothetical protein AB670_02862 [Chryseobacterium sp. MOF25P]|jgi:hypothetical protein|nr:MULTISPECIES: hypothetical protein [unclassified Chryseobacterium]OBW40778.1 hypothetical protein AB670_02862 [Chryseobacterium sp. MOF25P]OBW47066.1 hypothetical protein AB671_00762 [Chryseobacterium sp. BGARF1]
MENKKSFDYENTPDRNSEMSAKAQNIIVKVLQIILGFIMAIFHM